MRVSGDTLLSHGGFICDGTKYTLGGVVVALGPGLVGVHSIVCRSPPHPISTLYLHPAQQHISYLIPTTSAC